MAWWNPADWSLSDWGTADWTEDGDAARVRALSDLDRTATARGWDAYWRGTVYDIVAAVPGDGHALDYWTAVIAALDPFILAWDRSGTPMPDGLVKQRDAWASAINAAATVLEGREQGTVSTVVGGTVAGAVEDVKEAVDPMRSPWPWVVGGALAIGAATYLRGR